MIDLHDLLFCCKTFRRAKHKIGPCRTFVAKYIINEKAHFDFSVQMLVDVGEANCSVLKSDFVI